MEKFSSKTQPIDEFDSIKAKISALNHPIRFEILRMLKLKEKKNLGYYHYIENYSMNSHEINDKLKDKHNIVITTQMLGQHLKKLREAGLINRIKVDIDEEGLPISRDVFAYYIEADAFEDLFLEVNFFTEELYRFIDLSKQTQESKNNSTCVMTVFNGKDMGKKLIINKNQVAFIGRKTHHRSHDQGKSLLLSNSYKTVSHINKPHLTVYNENDTWYIVDQNSTNGTYKSSNKLRKGQAEKLPNNSFVKLSKGPGCAVLYCSYD